MVQATRLLGGWDKVETKQQSFAGDLPEWNSGNAPYLQGVMVVKNDAVYQAVYSRNSATPEYRLTASTWRWLLRNSVTVIDWMLAVSLFVIAWLKMETLDKVGSLEIVFYSISVIVVHELSLDNHLALD